MNIITVPQDLYQKHENEWLAIRQSPEIRIAKSGTDTPIWQIPAQRTTSGEEADKR